VIRVRGKSIIVALIAVCLVSPFIWSGKAQGEMPALSVYPSAVYGSPLEGENEFIIEIQIANVTGLYAYGFTLKIAPLEKVIQPLLSSEQPYWEEGSFLKTAGDTYFAMRYDKVLGTIQFGCTLTSGEGAPGASGTGTLVRIHFKVLEAGESPLTLEDSKLYDSYGVEIVHSATSGYYYGPIADLVAKKLTKNTMRVGETQILNAKVKNFADIPLYVKANFQMMAEDGRTWNLWTGLNELGAASYDGWMQWQFPAADGDFTGDGDPVGAIAATEGMVGGGNLKPVYGYYVEDYDPYLVTWSSSRKRYGWYNLADLGYWEFGDITIPEGRTIVSVTMDVYAWSDRDLPSDMTDMYLYNGEVEYLYWSMGYGSHLYNAYPAWFHQDITSMFDTQDKINAAAWWTEFFPYVSADVEGTTGYVVSADGNWMSVGYLTYGPPHPSWSPGQPLPPVDAWTPAVHQWHKDNVWEAIYVDCVHLTVETLPLVQPNDVVSLDPIYFGPLTAQDVGMFYCSVVVWFSYRLPLPAAAPPWNPAYKVQTFTWKCKP
jgi:hypothetical protein